MTVRHQSAGDRCGFAFGRGTDEDGGDPVVGDQTVYRHEELAAGALARLEGPTPVSDDDPAGIGRAIAALRGGFGQSQNREFRALVRGSGAGRID